MREIVCLAAPAIIMLVLVYVLTKKKVNIVEVVLEFLVYMVLNNSCLFLVLGPFEKIGLTIGEHGEMNVYYGGLALLASIVIAIGWSVLITFLHKNGVDAIIMQDFGMICLTRQMFPNLEIHASTQANNSSIETISLFEKIGVKRVVVSRELSLDEINSINVPIEIETFIHGALCISYSGNCLMSSMMGKRSGNRGECTGCCRLPYTLYENDRIVQENKYLLSTKELNTSNNISKLLESNITSFKIEGRMKSPEYVGFITKLYRILIDKYYDNKYVKRVMSGLRTATVGLISSALIIIMKETFLKNTSNLEGIKYVIDVIDILKNLDYIALLGFTIIVLLYKKYKLNVIYYILFGGIYGIIAYSFF